MPDQTAPPMPTEGGSYIRDPKTGALTRQPDDVAQPEEPSATETAPKPQEPAKKGGK